MSPGTEVRAAAGLVLLACGLGLGVVGDGLLRGPLGLGAALFLLAFTLATLALQRWYGTPAEDRLLPCAAVVVLASLGLVWRDAGVLKALDVLVFVAAFGLLASLREGQDARLSLLNHTIRVADTGLRVPLGPPRLLFQDTAWSDIGLRPALVVCAGLVRGAGLALPIVLVFAVLLISADPVFAARVGDLFDIELVSLFDHLAGVAAGSWIAAGLLRAAVIRADPQCDTAPRPGWLALDPLEVGVILGLVDLLFAAFVWIQVRYLFGGTAWVRKVAGLSYSEYARRGFFELVFVVGLVLSLLLVVHWLLRPSPAGARLFALLGGAQVALVLVILASALVRMSLYQAEYGQTELRFYSTAFMLWLGVLLAGFSATVLRGRREPFARFLVGSALAAPGGPHRGRECPGPPRLRRGLRDPPERGRGSGAARGGP
jgi:hypothetical protein